ncbi:MAG: class I SAM-dependent methyltransferase [Planctomycetota bacterium]
MVRIAMAAQPRLVFEIGTGHGSAIANIAKHTEARFVTTCPTPEEVKGTHVTFEHLPKGDIGRRYRAVGYQYRVVQVYMNSREFQPADYAAPHSCDLAIIDGCHDTDTVRADFLKMKPMMRPGGLVMLHDCHHEKTVHTKAVHMACLQLRRLGHDIRSLPDSWWAIWGANG